MNTTLNNSVREDEDLSISRIGPWQNKEEFVNVYKLLYSETADRESQQRACAVMTVWKLRRQQLTPASILSTLAILEVQLKDDPNCSNKSDLNNLRTLYSNAFTRFLNYMSSIMQNKYLKSMYMTAKELGIESFLVDLRHLCAHGQVMPSLDVFRRTATYCLNWLHDFYWKREIQIIQDASVQNIRQKSSIEFETNVEELFRLYDVATEAFHKGFRIVGHIEADKLTDPSVLNALNDYALARQQKKLTIVITYLTNELTTLASRESRVRGNDTLYCNVLIRCKYFIETAASYSTYPSMAETTLEKQIAEFVGIHQNLFRSLAICGFIESCFNALIDVCEDDHESTVRRYGAGFWANQIAAGFILFKEVKRVFKARKEKNHKFVIDLAPVNTEVMTSDIRKIYKDLGISCSGVLIFGDTVRRPWTLTFNRNYINDRIVNVSKYTKDVIDKCIALADQPFTEEQYRNLKELVNVYVGDEHKADESVKNVKKPSTADDNDPIYTVEEHLMKRKSAAGSDVRTENGEKRYGIWSDVTDNHNWQSVPLGRLPWE